ncbi:hypothetical protein HRI_003732100 [Hibiscus trionum]|uniref:ZF-HD dimerization-type domain-containing protein n=1 Tax=Hibiscus trionum TaxID=183268 RepID=A0A9W7IVB1_HIBTR|nr:hypothetical protein HRI_003732100 [Hibiscus trionum]
MEGETRGDYVIKLEAVPDVKPSCSALVPYQTQRICRYKECRRNHAASFVRYAIDGCREFICCKDDDFMCAACGCHRSFHRRDYPSNSFPPPQTPFLAPLPLASHNGLTGETYLFNIAGGAEVEENENTNKRAKRTRLTLEQKNRRRRDPAHACG